MEITVERTVYVDIDYIIEEHILSKASSPSEIKLAVQNYIDGLDDCDYYALDNKAEEKIIIEVFNRLK